MDGKIVRPLMAAAAAALAVTLTACAGSHGEPPPSSASRVASVSSSAPTEDRQDACRDALQAEIVQALNAHKTGKVAIPTPAACNGLSHAQVQALSNQVMDADNQIMNFGSAISQAMDQ